MAFCIEGKKAEELPERLLGAFRSLAVAVLLSDEWFDELLDLALPVQDS